MTAPPPINCAHKSVLPPQKKGFDIKSERWMRLFYQNFKRKLTEFKEIKSSLNPKFYKVLLGAFLLMELWKQNTNPTKQSRVRSSPQSTPGCGPAVGTCTICSSGPSRSTEPASGSGHRVGRPALEAGKVPGEEPKGHQEEQQLQAAEQRSFFTSWRGKAAANAPSATSRSTPTSAFFRLPYTVLARISYT